VNCTLFAELAPDLALGLLAEPDRADALAHARSCRSCREELTSLSSVVDELSLLAPAVEPPVGFEQRAVSALASAVEAPAPDAVVVPLRPRVIRRFGAGRWVGAAAAVVVALALGLGAGWQMGHHGASRPPEAVPVVHGELADQGHPVGEVIAYGGPSPWLYMTVDVGHMNGAVECVLDVGGHRVAMGSFGVTDGIGYWSTPLRQPVSGITGARLVQADGQVLASAVLSPG
jgi:hypothetical protein